MKISYTVLSTFFGSENFHNTTLKIKNIYTFFFKMRKFLFLKDSEWTLLWLNKIPRITVIYPVIMRKADQG